MVENGDRVKDRISGLTGIAIGITTWLYGCTRICVQPEESKDGKPADNFTVDEPQLEIVKKKVMAGRAMPTHGPREDAPRRKDVGR